MKTEKAYPIAKVIHAIKKNGGTKQDAEKELGILIDDGIWSAMAPASKVAENGKRRQL